MTSKIQVRRDTHANWVSVNPTLSAGEIGFETDTGKFKIGDGIHSYTDLYFAALSPEQGGFIFADIDMSDHRIKNVHLPVEPYDSANKDYVDDYADNAVSTHNLETTNVHGIVDTTDLATLTDLIAHNSDTTDVHGISDTSALATKIYADNAVSTHNSDTTNVHGITDTLQLASKTYADNAALDAITTSEEYTDSSISTHNSDTTNVHGIVDTSQLASKTYADLASADAITTSEEYTDSSISTHNSDTTNVHGIDDTSALATKTYADNAVSTHNSATTNVHGIADTSALATKTYADVQAQGAESNSNDYTDGKISTEVTNRNTAISNAISTEVSDRNTAISNAVDTAINTEVSNRNSAISTAKGEAISTSEGYTDNQITNLVNAAPSTLDTLKELADALGSDPNFATSVSNSIATKLPKAGGTMSGNIAMGSNNITGLAAPSSDNDAATKKYVDDQTTTDIAEGTNLYFTDERAQDAVGNNVGAGLSYNDSIGEISNSGVTAFNTRTGDITLSDTDVNDALGYVAANATDLSSLGTNTANDIADAITTAETYTDTLVNALTTSINTLTTSDIEEGTNLYFTEKRAQDSIGNNLGVSLSYNSGTGSISVNSSTVQYRVSGVSDTEIGYLDGVTSSIQNQIDSKLTSSTASSTYATIDSPTFLGTVAMPNGAMLGTPGQITLTNATGLPVSTGISGLASGVATFLETPSSANLAAALTDETGSSTVVFNASPGIFQPSISGHLNILSSADIVFEGSINDSYETTLTVINPTADQTISLPDATGTVALTSDLSSYLLLAGDTMSGDIAMGANKITGLANPTLDQDAATKAYVDAAVNNINVHEAVVAATTGNVNLTNAVDNNKVLDGVTLSTGNRILVKNQNTASQNGIYIVASNGAPTRATDYDLAGEVSAGDFVFVKSGTVNANTGWIQIADVTTVGTDSLSFTQFSGAGTYLAGNGLALSGNTFAIDTAITVDKTTAQTLTNKTLTSPTIGTILNNSGTLTLPTSTDTIVGRATTDTLTNKSISGSSNTLTNVPNSALTNSSVTVGTTAISLGSSSTTLAGLTSVTSNQFTGDLIGNAGTVTNGVYTTDTGTVTNTMLAGSIANTKLTNSSVTVGTTNISLGSSATTLAGLSSVTSTSFVGALTGNASTVTNGVYTTDTGTVTNTMLAGSIANTKLTNSKVTIGTTDVSLGSSSTTLAGLTSVTSTSFTGALTGNASTVTNGVYTTDTGTVTNTMLAGSITPSKISGTAVVQTDLASNVLTFLGTPTSANLAAALTDETGSTSAPKVVFSNTPAITSPLISTKLSLYTSAYIEFEGSTLDGIKTVLTVVDPTIARTITLPDATGTVVLKDSTDTFTNKTFDTADTGNVFKINGTQISAITGTGSAVLSASPTFTGTVGAAAITTTGNVIVGGDLTVNGTTTTLSSTTLTVADKNIEIANVATPTDVTANGAGITVKGASDKTFNWLSSTSSFTSSENLDLASGKTYKIAGTTVLTGSTIFGKTIGGTSSGDIVDINTIQTLTNKTLTTPVIASISNSGTITIPTGTDTLVGRNTTDTLTAKTLSTSCAVAYASGLTFSGSTGGTILQASNAASGTLTLPAPSVSDTLVGRATTDTLTNKTFGQSVASTTISFNSTATTVDTVSLASFTSLRYVVSIKQGSKIRTSEVIVQTDGTSVDSSEFGITETGGKMTGIAVTASVSSTNMVLQVSIGDALSTNATVKLNKVLL